MESVRALLPTTLGRLSSSESWYDGWSYFLSIARLDPRVTTTMNVYGGPMKMHLAYYGISRELEQQDRRANPLSYDNETDNFNQPHYELHNDIRLASNMTLHNTSITFTAMATTSSTRMAAASPTTISRRSTFLTSMAIRLTLSQSAATSCDNSGSTRINGDGVRVWKFTRKQGHAAIRGIVLLLQFRALGAGCLGGGHYQ